MRKTDSFKECLSDFVEFHQLSMNRHRLKDLCEILGVGPRTINQWFLNESFVFAGDNLLRVSVFLKSVGYSLTDFNNNLNPELESLALQIASGMVSMSEIEAETGNPHIHKALRPYFFKDNAIIPSVRKMIDVATQCVRKKNPDWKQRVTAWIEKTRTFIVYENIEVFASVLASEDHTEEIPEVAPEETPLRSSMRDPDDSLPGEKTDQEESVLSGSVQKTERNLLIKFAADSLKNLLPILEFIAAECSSEEREAFRELATTTDGESAVYKSVQTLTRLCSERARNNQIKKQGG